jgi:Na+-translocating ferredoxin:NAD+ oxidoreductase RnfG subunit
MRLNKDKVLINIIFLIVLAFVFSACGSPEDYPSIIDPERAYEEVALSNDQKTVYEHCTVENYYVSDDYKIFRVISERGYVDEVELLILINGTTIEKIMGIKFKESAAYGAKCFNDSYLEQFIGIDLNEVPELAGKDSPTAEGEIIYLTHATVTSKAIIAAVNAASAVMQNI